MALSLTLYCVCLSLSLSCGIVLLLMSQMCTIYCVGLLHLTTVAKAV